MMGPLYIFDLDGTLSLLGDRRKLLDETPKRYDEFYEACINDEPNIPVIHTMTNLLKIGAEIWIFSGRRDSVRGRTLAWLIKHTRFAAWRNPAALMMRPKNDHRPDDELKQLWVDRMLVDDRERLVATFDDRDRVVAMWRRNGISCFQVAPGDF